MTVRRFEIDSGVLTPADRPESCSIAGLFRQYWRLALPGSHAEHQMALLWAQAFKHLHCTYFILGNQSDDHFLDIDHLPAFAHLWAS